MTVIGLTGNSGTGKSSVAKVMEKYGALILDCDKIAHENMAVGGCAYDEIVSAFGKDILNSDKTINRKALGNIVFNDSQKLSILNKITHSKIAQRVKDEIAKASCKCVVIDAPLLIEGIMNRDGISRQEVLSRFSKQTPAEVLEKKADLIIDHSQNDFEKLEKEIYNYMKKEGLLNV